MIFKLHICTFFMHYYTTMQECLRINCPYRAAQILCILLQYSGLVPKVQCETRLEGLVEGVEINLGLGKSIKLSVKTA